MHHYIRAAAIALSFGLAFGGSGAVQVFTNRAQFEAILGSFAIESFEGAPLNGSVNVGSEGAIDTLALPFFTLVADPCAIEILDENTPGGGRNTTVDGRRYMNFDSTGYFEGIDGELAFEFAQPVFAFGFDYTSVQTEFSTFHMRTLNQGFFYLRPPPISPTAPVDGFWGMITSEPIYWIEIDDAEDGFFGIDEVTFTTLPTLGCPCAGPLSGGNWRNHGQYVACVSGVAETLFSAGEIGREGKSQMVSDAAHSHCGRK